MGTFILRTNDYTLQICLNLVLVKPVARKGGGEGRGATLCFLECNEK